MKSFLRLCTLFLLLSALAGCGSDRTATTTVESGPINNGFTAPGSGSYALGGSMQRTGLNFTATSVVGTFAGTAGTSGLPVDGAAKAEAKFNQPNGITTADGLTFYVTDYYNRRVRVITPDRKVSTLKNTAGEIDFYYPADVTIYNNNLFVADGSHVVRHYTIGADASIATEVTTYGEAYKAGAIDSADPAKVRFNDPTGLTVDGANVYVAESGNHTIRRIELATKNVTTVAGYPGKVGSSNGTGTAARFSTPSKITTDGTSLFVTDFYNRTIRRIDLATREVSVIAGSTDVAGEHDDPLGSNSTFNHPTGIATDGTYLYVTDINDTTLPNPQYKNLIRRIEIAGNNTVTLIAGGTDTTLQQVINEPGAAARFATPTALTVGSDGLYVADSGNHVIRRISQAP